MPCRWMFKAPETDSVAIFPGLLEGASKPFAGLIIVHGGEYNLLSGRLNCNRCRIGGRKEACRCRQGSSKEYYGIDVASVWKERG